MKILQVHNFYQQPGGEDEVCAAEYKLLADRGHEVLRYLVHNDAIEDMSAIGVTVRTIWNNKTYREIKNLLRAERPEVVHAHNTFPLVSPSLYYAAAEQSVPVIQTLHNFRLLCPAATLFRNGRICEECVGQAIPFPSVLHACYRGSRSATAVTASMLMAHRLARTWTSKVCAFIALTDFSRAKFIEGGVPAEKITVKPNCLGEDPGFGEGAGGYAVFAGRLTEEKGLRMLLKAWEQLGPGVPLRIAGDGPLSEWLRARIATLRNVEWLGRCNRAVMTTLLQNAACLVFPSQHYENLPMTIVEAFACGTPVIASRLGSLLEIVQDGVNGVYFTPGDATDLAAQVQSMWSDQNRLQAMRKSARISYEERYTVQKNYISLMELYKSVILTYKKASTLSL